MTERTLGRSAAPGDDWQPPPFFDEYRLVRRLGAGAMGEVYLAVDVLLQRQVALKFVRTAGDAAAAAERLYVEARAIARLQHPNVVSVYRVGRVRGRPYLVSEYVAGESLDRIALPLLPARVAEIGIALASGLASAHGNGVLHRDIKPANAIMSEAGDVKLLDFGLAKLLDEAPAPGPPRGPVVAHPALAEATRPTARTHPGTLLGSPLYMSPEVWRGELATAASDLYSLGVLLYELCAGRPPRHALSLDELRRAVQDSDVPPLATVAPAVPAGLAAVIERCLRRGPAARFASADALRRAPGRERAPAGAVAFRCCPRPLSRAERVRR
jgi:eukaryotic-like serine/threonine-protein kinase